MGRNLQYGGASPAADPIWVASWKNPQTDRDWRNLEYLGYQLEIAGSLLTIPGTEPLDKEWVAKPGWKEFALQLKNAGCFCVVVLAQARLL